MELSLHKNKVPMYTTQLQAGLGLLDETKLLLSLYQPEMTVTELFDEALSSGLFPMVAARRLRNIIAECFSPRYMKSNAARYLKLLTSTLSTPNINQLFLPFRSFLFFHRFLELH